MISAIQRPGQPASVGPTLGVSFARVRSVHPPRLRRLPGPGRFKEKLAAVPQHPPPRPCREVSIGHHGETMVGFLKPRLPLRHHPQAVHQAAARPAWKIRRGAPSPTTREELHHIEDAIRTFVDRELVSMLDSAPPPSGSTDVSVAHVAIGSKPRATSISRVRASAPPPARIAIEQQFGLDRRQPPRARLDRPPRRRPSGQNPRESPSPGSTSARASNLVPRAARGTPSPGDAELPPLRHLRRRPRRVARPRPTRTEAVYNLHARPAGRRDARRPVVRRPRRSSPAAERGVPAASRLRWSAWTAVWEQLGARRAAGAGHRRAEA